MMQILYYQYIFSWTKPVKLVCPMLNGHKYTSTYVNYDSQSLPACDSIMHNTCKKNKNYVLYMYVHVFKLHHVLMLLKNQVFLLYVYIYEIFF